MSRSKRRINKTISIRSVESLGTENDGRRFPAEKRGRKTREEPRGWKSKRGKFANRGSPRKQGHPYTRIFESDEEGLRGKRVAARLLLILAWTSEETFLFGGARAVGPRGGGVRGWAPLQSAGAPPQTAVGHLGIFNAIKFLPPPATATPY